MAENPYSPLPVSPSSVGATTVDQLPPVMGLVQQVGDRFMKSPVNYIGAGAIIFIDIVGSLVLLLPAMALLIVGSDQRGDSGLPFIIAGFAGIGIVLLLLMGFTAALQGAIMLTASEELDGGEAMSFGGVARRLGEGFWLGLPAVLLTQVLVMGGMSLCYFPAFLAIAVTLMLLPAMAQQKVGAFEGLGIAYRRFMAAPGWHIRLLLADMLVSLIASFVPMIGVAILIPVRALLLSMAWRAVKDLKV